MRGRTQARRLAGGRGRHRLRRQRRSVTAGDTAYSERGSLDLADDLNATWSYSQAMLGLGGEQILQDRFTARWGGRS